MTARDEAHDLLKVKYIYWRYGAVMMLILTIDKVSNNESVSLKVIPADCCTLFETLCVMAVESGPVDTVLSCTQRRHPSTFCSTSLFERCSQSQECWVALKGEKVKLLVLDSGDFEL